MPVNSNKNSTLNFSDIRTVVCEVLSFLFNLFFCTVSTVLYCTVVYITVHYCAAVSAVNSSTVGHIKDILS